MYYANEDPSANTVQMCLCVCQPGEEFYVEDCQLKCRCDAPFVTCVASECPPMHECKLQGGELGCYPTGKNTPTKQLVMNYTVQWQHHRMTPCYSLAEDVVLYRFKIILTYLQ